MFEELKAKQSVMWGNGPYERITDLLTESQEDLVAALKPQAGEKWLDVATGTGAVARMAARAGADVTGLDLAPDLIETARAPDGVGRAADPVRRRRRARRCPTRTRRSTSSSRRSASCSRPITPRWRASSPG